MTTSPTLIPTTKPRAKITTPRATTIARK
jgi:hypothetical protein